MAELREGGEMTTHEVIESNKLQVNPTPNLDKMMKETLNPRKYNWRSLLQEKDYKEVIAKANEFEYHDDNIISCAGSKLSKSSTAY